MTDVGRDERLENELRDVWQRANTPAKDIEVWPIPRPTGGIGLCVNFLPTNGSQSDSMIIAAIRYLVEQHISHQFSALQFGVNTLRQGSARLVVSARYFFENDRVRSIERDIKCLDKSSLDSLVTTKIVNPLVSAKQPPHGS